MTYDFRSDPILGAAYDYWQTKRGERVMPGRRDIDPVEMPRRLLPNLQITEVVDGGMRFRYRLTGTAVVEAYGAPLTGLFYDQLFSGERLRRIEANLRRVCGEKQPVLVCNQYHSSRDVELLCARVILPLSDDGSTVSQFLMAMSFHFPGAAHQWRGEWFGNDGTLDFGKSYERIIQPA